MTWHLVIWQRTTCTVERNIKYVYDIDQLYNQSRLDPDETILQVVLKGSFLTTELTNLARHCLEISAVLKDDKGTILFSLKQRFFSWINWNIRNHYLPLLPTKWLMPPLRLFYTEILRERDIADIDIGLIYIWKFLWGNEKIIFFTFYFVPLKTKY